VGDSSSSSQDSVTAGFFLGFDAWGLMESLFRVDSRAIAYQHCRVDIEVCIPFGSAISRKDLYVFLKLSVKEKGD
jgi:hypothetical protein